MAINATFQISEPGATGALAEVAKTLKNIYTVLKLDYTVERSCDKTGRPSGGASISVITVTIRAAKEFNTPFHTWIAGDDKLMNGEIKIYDSTEMLSSSIQDATGIDPLIDVDEVVDIPNDMMGTAMGTAMDNASNYESRDLDPYDEMSHSDLVACANEKELNLSTKESSDDDIRDLLRARDEVSSNDIKKIDNEVKDMTVEELEEYAEENGIKKFVDPTKDMTYKELEEYAEAHGLKIATKATKEAYQKVVKEDMQKSYYQPLVRCDKKTKKARAIRDSKKVDQQTYQSAYQKADKLKQQTVSTSKGLVKEVVKRNTECARSISFEDAYCISLKEQFNNNPDSDGKLNSSYPWILEIGFKPKKVVVTGEQFATVTKGTTTEFKLY